MKQQLLKTEKIIEKYNGKVNFKKFDPANVHWLPFVNEVNTTLQKNHCRSISFLDLLPLEVRPTKGELRRIRQYNANFKIGLYDEVIHNYFSVICKTQRQSVILWNNRRAVDIALEVFMQVMKNQPIQKHNALQLPHLTY